MTSVPIRATRLPRWSPFLRRLVLVGRLEVLPRIRRSSDAPATLAPATGWGRPLTLIEGLLLGALVGLLGVVAALTINALALPARTETTIVHTALREAVVTLIQSGLDLPGDTAPLTQRTLAAHGYRMPDHVHMNLHGHAGDFALLVWHEADPAGTCRRIEVRASSTSAIQPCVVVVRTR